MDSKYFDGNHFISVAAFFVRIFSGGLGRGRVYAPKNDVGGAPQQTLPGAAVQLVFFLIVARLCPYSFHHSRDPLPSPSLGHRRTGWRDPFAACGDRR